MSLVPSVNYVKLAICIITMLFLAYRLARPGHGKRHARNPVFWALLAVPSLLAYFDLGAFHNGVFLHDPEQYHYYMGSKYFKELGYYDLYNATVVADAEEGFRENTQTVRDLHDYQFIRASSILKDAPRYRDRFSAMRWRQFKSDLRYFRNRLPRKLYIELLRDHGYNPSPAWSTTGGILSNLIPVEYLTVVGLLDLALLLEVEDGPDHAHQARGHRGVPGSRERHSVTESFVCSLGGAAPTWRRPAWFPTRRVMQSGGRC